MSTLEDKGSRKSTRVVLTLALIVGLYLAGRVLGLESYLHADRLRALVADAGAWGPVAFMVSFVLAVVGQVPGLVFVFAAPALFPLPVAWALCFLASNLAVVLNFELVRRVGGQPLAEFERPWLQKLFGQLEQHPIRTVALLRTITIMFPPVTGALALTQIDAKDHFIGSLLGMLLPISALLIAAGFFIG